MTKASQSATATPPTASTVFDFAPPLVVAPGTSVSFALSAMIAANPAMLDRRVVMYAAVAPGFGSLADRLLGASPGAQRGPDAGLGQLSAGLGLLGLLLMPLGAGRRRRALVLAMLLLLAAGAAGCGDGATRGLQSTQVVPAGGIAPTNAGGPVSVGGLPATLGTIHLLG